MSFFQKVMNDQQIKQSFVYHYFPAYNLTLDVFEKVMSVLLETSPEVQKRCIDYFIGHSTVDKTQVAEILNAYYGEDYAMTLGQSWINEGIEQGIEQGMEKAMRKVARKMLYRDQEPIDKIIDYTGLSKQDLKDLGEEGSE